MTYAEFQAMTARATHARQHVCQLKNHEYADPTANPFVNFFEEARETGVSPLVVWLIYASKHWRAIRSFLRQPTRPGTESMRSRIDDLQNYLDLLRGLLADPSLIPKVPPSS